MSVASALAHRLVASLGPDADLAASLEALGRREAAQGDPCSAGLHLLQAARVSSPGPERRQRVLGGVEAYFLAGHIGAAEEARLELADLPPSSERACFLGHLALWRARAAEADDELRWAWALLDDPEAAPVLGVGITTQLTILSLLYYRFDEAVEWANRSLELSEGALWPPGALPGRWPAAVPKPRPISR